MITVGDAFAGLGGFSLVFEHFGCKTVWFIENEPFCQKVLRKHFDAPIHGDIYECHDLPYVDILTAGFPCQPFSVAGARKGEKDERYLLPELLRVIEEVQPRVVLFENVPGFPSLTDGNAFKLLLKTLAEMGYDALWGHLRASDAGAPHLRERWFCVAYANGSGTRNGRGRRTCDYSERHTPPVEYRRHYKQSRIVAHGQTMAYAQCGGEHERGWERFNRVESNRWGETSIGRINPAKTQRLGKGQELAYATSQYHKGCKLYRSHGGQSETPAGNRSSVTVRRCAQSFMGRDTSRISAGMDGCNLVIQSHQCYNTDGFQIANGDFTNATPSRYRTGKILRPLRQAVSAKCNEWSPRGLRGFQTTKVLRPNMHRISASQQQSYARRVTETRRVVSQGCLSFMRDESELTGSSYGWQPSEQFRRELDDFVRFLSHPMALGEWQIAVQKAWGLSNLRAALKEYGIVPEASTTLQVIWRSLSYQEKSWIGIRASQGVRLDRFPFPARPNEAQHASEPPRVTTQTEGRAARLKALGNSIVPQSWLPIAEMIVEWLKANPAPADVRLEGEL